MTESQREQVDDLFGDLLEQDPSTWRAALAAVDDPEVRAKVQMLLRHSAPTAKGLDTSIAEVMRAATVSGAFDDRTIGPGTRFERYRIERKIGQGGMGDVYEAVRENDFHKRVALKIVRYGLDSDYARGRFQQERQTLAGLEHPFIARLLDGGEAENGCPYLVLEFVDGVPIDTFCQGRSQRDILQLFLKVCEAVEYAHRNLVIHRDLKPANILVTPDGDPKLLDFGIAKLLDPSSNVTQTMAVALTPQYASPEQIRNQPITTASDVYSLGVILYQLLTGRKPYNVQTTTPLEMERVICLEAPEPAHLGNELDDILMMALRKEPDRRYAGVVQFAQDIQRFLDGETVGAAPDTFRYRAGKFLRRHKIGIAAVAAVIITLVAGLASTLYQKHRAELEMERSERRFQDVRSLANTFLFDFHDKIRPLPGSTEAREMVVTTALKYLDKLSLEAGNDRSLLFELQSAYSRTGDVQGDPTGPSLGHADAAMKSYGRSAEIGEQLRAAPNVDTPVLDTLGTVYYRIGMLHISQGSPAEGIASLQKGLAIAEQMKGKSNDAYVLAVRCYTGLAYAQRAIGETQAAADSTAKALAAEIEGDKLHPSPQTPRALVMIRTQLGNDTLDRGDLNAALKEFQTAATIGAPLLTREHQLKAYDRFQRSLAFAYGGAAEVSGDPFQPNLGNPGASAAYWEKSVALLEAVADDDPKDQTIRRSLVEAYTRFSSTLSLSDPARAKALYGKAIATAEALDRSDVNDPGNQIALAEALFGQGRLQNLQNQHPQAVQSLTRSLSLQRALPPADAATTDSRHLLAQTLLAVGTTQTLHEGLSIAEALWKDHSHNISVAALLAGAYEAQGDAARSAKNCAEARNWYTRSADLWKSWPQHGVSSVYDVEQARRADGLVSQCR